jgi:hypothetical protein
MILNIRNRDTRWVGYSESWKFEPKNNPKVTNPIQLNPIYEVFEKKEDVFKIMDLNN